MDKSIIQSVDIVGVVDSCKSC